jgi:cation diffusion facilitator family transporter
MSSKHGSHAVVVVALCGNLAIAITKFVAAALTGSSAMLSEGVHSAVDTTNELLLLYGMRRASRPASRTHPFGSGREIYFWSFMVALLVFALGAGVAVYEGIVHVIDPEPMGDPTVNYIVLGISMLFEGGSWWMALREFRARKGDLGYFEAIRLSKDPTTFTVLLEDSAALLGLLVAAAGIAGAHLLDMPVLDGVASLCIGLLLACASLLLARETKGLLLGESAHPHVRDAILRIASADPAVRCANGVFTVQMGPDQVVAALSAEFEDALTTPQVEACVTRIEQALAQAQPVVTVLFVKPQTQATWKARTSTQSRPS